MNHSNALFRVTQITAACLVFGLANAGVQDDLAHRSPDIHWPGGFEPEKADLFAHNDLIINASCERVWRHIIDANRWPAWYPNSKDVEILDGYAPGAKPSFYHSWYLEPEGTMCHVVMDEAGVGKDAAGLRKSDETLMHRGHDLWLATLKWVAEAK